MTAGSSQPEIGRRGIMTALIGDVIIPLSHGFDLGPFILGCALASIFAFTLAAFNRSVGNERVVAKPREQDRSVNAGRIDL
jgi:hypothetical protein